MCKDINNKLELTKQIYISKTTEKDYKLYNKNDI